MRDARQEEREAARGVTYKSKPIEDLTRLELIEALAYMAHQYDRSLKGTIAQFETLYGGKRS